jgi:hypothetical protein
LDLNLPVSDVPWPVRSEISPETVYLLNSETWATQVLDDAYWAWSLAGKNPEPFVM